MIDTPTVVQSVARRTAVIHLTVPRAEIQSVMDPAIGEVMAAVAAQGLKPAGPVFSYHLRRPTDVFDFEVGLPVDEPFTATGRVRPGTLPATTVARTVYHGPYEGLGRGWGELHQWIAAEGHRAEQTLWECYAVGPGAESDPSLWRTEFHQPLEVPR